jgi:hypothetical protein
MECALSTGAAFPDAAMWPPAPNAIFTDAAGWNLGAGYYSTLR